MDPEPTEEDLRAFVRSMLSNLDRLLIEPEVVDDSIRRYREMWVRLYRASSGLNAPER